MEQFPTSTALTNLIINTKLVLYICDKELITQKIEYLYSIEVVISNNKFISFVKNIKIRPMKKIILGIAFCVLGALSSIAQYNISAIVDTNMVCFGDMSTFTDISTTTGGNVLTWNWDFGDGNTSTLQNPSHTYASTGAYHVVLTLTNDSSDVHAGDTIAIMTINDIPTAALVGIDVTCSGSADGSIDATVSGGALPYSFNWSSVETTEDIFNVMAGTYSLDVTDNNGCMASQETYNITEPAALIGAIATSVDVTCFGSADGSATVFVSGGTAPYNYSWNTGGTNSTENNLTTDVYTATSTDFNGCVVSVSGSLSGPSQINLTNASVFGPTCYGGSDAGLNINVVTGGTSPYTFIWTNGQTTQNYGPVPLGGSDGVTVTDAIGCTQTQYFGIPSTPIIEVLDSIVNVSTNGGNDGEIHTFISGGTGPYTYMWADSSNTASVVGLAAGSYDVDVVDANGCSVTHTVSVAEPATLIVGISTSDEINGCDGSANAAVTGGTAPYAYNWMNGITVSENDSICAGSYLLVVTDAAGAADSSSYTIAAAPLCNLGVTFSSSDPSTIGANDGTIDLVATGVQGNVTYAWDPNNVDFTSSVNNLGAGTYMAVVADDFISGCQDTVVIILSDPAAPALVASATFINESVTDECDGSGEGVATGGDGNYTYNWLSLPDSSSVDQSSSTQSLCAGTYLFVVTDSNGSASTEVIIGTDSVPAQSLVVVAISTNTTCGGVCDGIGTLTATGGTAPYTYAWSNGSSLAADSTLCAGTFSYTVTDASGNTGLGYVNILSGAALTVDLDSIGITNATCGNADGTAGVMAVGGTAPFTYGWSGGQNTAGITNVSAGMHIVVVTDDSGCTSTFSLVVADVSGPSITVASSTDANCGGADGSIMIDVTGGTAPYTYLWANGVTEQNMLDAASGVQYVEVTDANGCVGSTSAYIASSGTNAPTIFGNVTSQAGGNIISGSIAIYSNAPYAPAMDTIARSPIDNQGNFYFSSISPIGDYIVQVIPDVVAHPNAIPTYIGLTNRWDSAAVISVSCDQDLTISIEIFDLIPLDGFSIFGGIVISDGTGGRRAGDPIPGIDVSLEQIPGGIIAFTETETDGKYAFDNVPTGNGEVYVLHVDIPGKDNATTYEINTISTDTIQDNLDFVVSEGEINSVAAQPTGLANLQVKSNINMYPNPSNGDIFFNMEVVASANVNYVIYNIVGEQVQSKDLGTFNNGVNKFKVTGLSAGVYTIAVNQGNVTSTFKAMVVE